MTDGERKGVVKQLRERKVIRVVIAYVALGWVLMQVGEVSSDARGLRSSSSTPVITLRSMGWPVAIVLARAYALSSDGLRRDPADQRAGGNPAPELDRNAASIGVLPFDEVSRFFTKQQSDKPAATVSP